MVVVAPGPALLDAKVVSCWHASDSLLGNQPVVVFIGSSVSGNITQATSRIQAHVFTVAGFRSFSRLTVSPSANDYAAVNKLPADLQGDETRRALAFALYHYYNELSSDLRQTVLARLVGAENGAQLRVFDDYHAASLAAKMRRTQNADAVAGFITAAVAERSVSWLDVDVVVPTSSVTVVPPSVPDGRASLVPLPDTRSTIDYGRWQGLLELLGEATFLPTSRMRRAPSKPTAVSKNRHLDDTKLKALRREMRELVMTEENYVSKLRELADSTAASEAASSQNRMMQKLFPPSLGEIVRQNQGFLEQIGDALEEDNAAPKGESKGVLRFSKILYEYIPKLREPYQDYMQLNGQFSKFVTEIIKDRNSTAAQAILATGEQRLRSWLIEPVQRLPRYSMFIDNMVNLLPADHPAVSRFLRARDIVTDICALENEGPQDDSRAIERLRNIVQGWEENFTPTGRLVTAVDCNELQAPFAPDPYGKAGVPLVMLLFPNALVCVEKLSNVSARGILAEVDRSASVPPLLVPDHNSSSVIFPLAFRYAISLKDVRMTESYSGRLLNVASSKASRELRPESIYGPAPPVRVFQVLNAYEGKAGRICDEAAMARIEHRYSENDRENDRWALRRSQAQPDDLGLICAITSNDDFTQVVASRLPLGRVRIVMDSRLDRIPPKVTPTFLNGVEILINVSLQADGRIVVQTLMDGKEHVDTVTEERFFTAVTKRLAYCLKHLHDPTKNTPALEQYVAHTQTLAVSLDPLLNDNDEFGPPTGTFPTETRRFRTRSPVKGLSNFLTGTQDRAASPTKMFGTRIRAESTKAAAAPPVLATPQQVGRPLTYHEPGKVHGQGTLEAHGRPVAKDPTKQLQETFESFVMAIQSRQGNIVGTSLMNRRRADEAAVNELLNVLMADPKQLQVAAEVSVDVLFASFEKFLQTVWNSRISPILPSETLDEMTGVLFSNSPAVVQRFKVILTNMGTVNSEAFTVMIKLLSDLTGGIGNEVDRGTLMVTFAELLIVREDASKHLVLFDRLIADSEMFFGFSPPGSAPEQPERTRATGTGSIGSTASSIGKRFGMGMFGLGRSDSKTESESTFGGLFRFGSKRSKKDEPDATPPSLGRSVLSRTRSTDTRPTTPGSPSLSRPGSSYSGQVQDGSRPGSAHGLITSLAPIDETKFAQPAIAPRKKRRSSLSDLPDIRRTGQHASNPASPAARNNNAASTSLATPPKPQDRTSTVRPRPLPRAKSPSSSAVLARGRPTVLKENTPPVLLQQQDPNAPLADPFTIPPLRVRATKSPTPSGIPVACHGPQLQQQAPQLSPTKPAPQHQQPRSTSPNKLKMQSPQKLRDRLDREKRLMLDTGPSLQSSIDLIGQELAGNPNPSRIQVAALASRVADMERALEERMGELGARTDGIRADLKHSLAVSEAKNRRLDELLAEARSENEVLYERVNDELEKIMRGVRGDGMAEMRRLLKATQDDNDRLRREVATLKRQKVGLQSKLNDA